MNYRLMACGQFSQEDQEDLEDDDTPETEDYEEDSESDVEDDNDSSSKDYAKELVGPTSCVPSLVTASNSPKVEANADACALTALTSGGPHHQTTKNELLVASAASPPENTTTPACAMPNNDEGFIDESDCDCDARNFCEDGENRVPFQYCFSCAPFHPSNGRGPTLVGPQLQPSGNNPTSTCAAVTQNSTTHSTQEPESKLIYDMDSKSTQNQSSSLVVGHTVKRKRQVSSEETEDAVNSILPKKRRDSCASEGHCLDDSGFQEDEKVFHPAFRGQGPSNGMEVDQITSLVSIFSFGQQLFNSSESASSNTTINDSNNKQKDTKDDDDSDSDSDTSSDSGHSSDDHEAHNDEKPEDPGEDITKLQSLESRTNQKPELTCLAQAKDKDLEVSSVSVATAV